MTAKTVNKEVDSFVSETLMSLGERGRLLWSFTEGRKQRHHRCQLTWPADYVALTTRMWCEPRRTRSLLLRRASIYKSTIFQVQNIFLIQSDHFSRSVSFLASSSHFLIVTFPFVHLNSISAVRLRILLVNIATHVAKSGSRKSRVLTTSGSGQ